MSQFIDVQAIDATRNNFMYDSTFNGNMLVVGQTRCTKTRKKQNAW